MIQQLRDLVEKQFFGVCSWWGNKLGIKTSRIRVYFIYTSCLTLGSPLLIYLVMAFILEHKDSFKIIGKKRIWDL
ncbi:MAG: hypothetical protein RLZZ414_1670 [Bacteroidota bacterium]|jgi:phage shock protein C